MGGAQPGACDCAEMQLVPPRGGYRGVIAEAAMQGIPVLTALRPDYAGARAGFGGDATCVLAPDLRIIPNLLNAWQSGASQITA